jgi:hypothetical protein
VRVTNVTRFLSLTRTELRYVTAQPASALRQTGSFRARRSLLRPRKRCCLCQIAEAAMRETDLE